MNAPAPMTGLTHVRFVVDDFVPMLGFYREALGFRVVVDVPGVYVELDTGAARIGLVARAVMAGALDATPPTDRTSGTTPTPPPTVPTMATPATTSSAAADVVLQLRVANVDAAAEWLASRGVVLASAPHDQRSWMLRVVHVRDPLGHLVELTTPLTS